MYNIVHQRDYYLLLNKTVDLIVILSVVIDNVDLSNHAVCIVHMPQKSHFIQIIFDVGTQFNTICYTLQNNHE